ncbi:MAG: dNTP triphosphohydrolase [Polyangia bacterium]
MKRVSSDGSVHLENFDQNRTEFERDYDRVLMSTSFRRLRDKTQVFALSENDHVHSRLTHSLVVASVGRTLGTAVGRTIIQDYPDDFRPELHHGVDIRPSDFGDIVAAACLAHDIGNPPFGHSGEDAIGKFFEEYFERRADVQLSDAQRADFTKFEGNAQGFRILGRLENHGGEGLKLTAATLGAFSKYPREAGDADSSTLGVAAKKTGFLQSERAMFMAMAAEVGLDQVTAAKPTIVYRRHPLAFLVEAADDITYRILDIDDGLHLNLVPLDEVISCFERIARRKPGYTNRNQGSHRENFDHLRGTAISELRDEVCRVFRDNQLDILAGTYAQPIFEEIESKNEIATLYQIMERYCYAHQSVLEIELAGYKVLGGLLEMMVEAATVAPAKLKKRHKHIRKLIGYGERAPGSLYHQLLCVTDYVSGMTDRYAVNLYRKLAGVSLPTGSR